MNSSEDIRLLINAAVFQLNVIKTATFAVVEALDSPQNADILQKIYEKVSEAERYVTEKVPTIQEQYSLYCKANARESFALVTKTGKAKGATVKLVREVDQMIKICSAELGLPMVPTTTHHSINDEEILQGLKEKYRANGTFSVVERNPKWLKIEFDCVFGVKIAMKCKRGKCLEIHLRTSRDSLILQQLKNVIDMKINEMLKSEMWNYEVALQKFRVVLEKYKQIFTRTCKGCRRHLNFASGIPMVPLVIARADYFHIECFSE